MRTVCSSDGRNRNKGCLKDFIRTFFIHTRVGWYGWGLIAKNHTSILINIFEESLVDVICSLSFCHYHKFHPTDTFLTTDMIRWSKPIARPPLRVRKAVITQGVPFPWEPVVVVVGVFSSSIFLRWKSRKEPQCGRL